MTERKSITLKSICDAVDYGLTASASLSTNGLKFLRITDIVSGFPDWKTVPTVESREGVAGKYRINDGDIVIARTGASTGAARYIENPPEAVFASYLVRLKVRKDLASARFIYYLLQTSEYRHYVESVSVGKSAQPNASAAALVAFTFDMPRLQEQEAISEVLRALDDKIAVNDRIAAISDELCHLQFEFMFGRGADVGVQEGWRRGRLSDLCATQYGYTAKGEAEPIGPRFLRVKDINKKNWIQWEEVPYCLADSKAKEKYQLEVGDILVARMADPGKSAIVEEVIDALFASYLVRLKSDSLASAYFIWGFLKSPDYQRYTNETSGGSVQANMNARVITQIELDIPPYSLMETYCRTILPLRKRILAAQSECQKLRELRDTLLPRLMSGEIRVKDAEKIAEEAT